MPQWSQYLDDIHNLFGECIPMESLIEAAKATEKKRKATGVIIDVLNWLGVEEETFNLKFFGQE